MFPNPASEFYIIHFDVENQADVRGELRVYDAQGRLMLVQKAQQDMKIDIEGEWPNGIYGVGLVIENNITTRRLVVIRE